MTINEDDFILTPSLNNASPIWDLELRVTIKGKEGDRFEFKNVAYGITLENAIKRIANYRVLHNNGDSQITLKSYIDQYKEAVNEIYELCSAM